MIGGTEVTHAQRHAARRADAGLGEFRIGALAVLATLLIAARHGLPVALPTPATGALVGIHYLYPLMGAVGLVAAASRCRAPHALAYVARAGLGYAGVLWAHFALKLWTPVLTDRTHDAAYRAIDAALPGLHAAFVAAAGVIDPWFPPAAYLVGFIALFYLVILLAALRGPDALRMTLRALILFQLLGTLAYFVAPATGPFLQAPSPVADTAALQADMLRLRHAIDASDGAALATLGGDGFLLGIAAMPSLHMGGAVLFVLLVRRLAPVVLPFVLLVAGAIAVQAVALRWHYLIDLPVGALLALVTMRLVDAWAAGAGSPPSLTIPKPWRRYAAVMAQTRFPAAVPAVRRPAAGQPARRA